MECESSLNRGLPLCPLCSRVFFYSPRMEAFEAIDIKKPFVNWLLLLADTHPGTFLAWQLRHWSGGVTCDQCS